MGESSSQMGAGSSKIMGSSKMVDYSICRFRKMTKSLSSIFGIERSENDLEEFQEAGFQPNSKPLSMRRIET